MNTAYENWLDGQTPEYIDWMKKMDALRKSHPKVYEQYMKEAEEHVWSCKHDEYYRYCHGGGTVPVPCCQYCTGFDGEYCMKEWNNADKDNCVPERDEREADDLCDDYEWNGNWEE